MIITRFSLTSFIWISNSTSLYNWSKRGVSSTLAINADQWRMSFIVAISSRKVEGLLASTGSINSKSFWLFIKDVKESNLQFNNWDKKSCFIFDNSSLHRSQEFKKFTNMGGIRWITIPPYTPQLNPAEKIISVIKVEARRQWMNSRVMSLDKIRAIIDGIEKATWEKWIKSSMIESFKYMMHMKNS